MTKYTLSILFCLWLLNACKFDDIANEPRAPTEPAQKPFETSAPELKTPTKRISNDSPKVQFTWDASEATKNPFKRNILERKGRVNELYLENPITFPHSAPDTMFLEIPYLPLSSIRSGKNLSLTVNARLDSLTNKPFELPILESTVTYQTSPKGPSNIHFTILGLKGLISSTKEDTEQKLFISLELKFPESNSQTVILDMILMSPPSLLKIQQWTSDQFESMSSTLPTDTKVLKAQKLQLSLLQIVQIQNLSDQTISFDSRAKIMAKLVQTMVYHPPAVGELCSDQEENTTSEYLLSDSIVVLPFFPSLEKAWYRWLDQDALNLRILPGKKILLGVYVEQQEPLRKPILQILNERNSSNYTKAHPLKQTTINVGCDFGCAWPNTDPAFEKQCNGATGSSHEICAQKVAACLPCLKRFLDRVDRNNPVEFGSDCNQCRLFEYNEPLSPGYESRPACRQGWQKRPFSQRTIQYGYEAREIKLEVQSALAKLRYGHSTPDEDPSFRFVQFLRKSSVQIL